MIAERDLPVAPEGSTAPPQDEMPPLDPSKLLQLHADAPRDLVEATYWLLASERAPAPTAARIQALNDAYGALIARDQGEPVRPVGYAARNGASGAPAPGLLRRILGASKPAAARVDHYHLLTVDVAAGPRVIAQAYVFWTHRLNARATVQPSLDEAHRVLSDPDLRAEYDARRSEHKTPEEGKITKRVPSQIQNARHNGANGAESPPVSSVAASARLAALAPDLRASTTELEAPRTPYETVVAVSPPIEVAPTLSLPPTYVVPVESHEPPAVEAVIPASNVSAENGPEPLVVPAQLAGRNGRADAPKGRADAHNGRAHAPKVSAARHLADAQDDRLLQLRESPDEDAPSPVVVPITRTQAPPRSSLTLTAGPLAGRRFDLSRDSLKLGADPDSDVVLPDPLGAVEPEHAQLTRRGDTYIFRDLAGHDTRVGGLILTLPLVILEDGDEIQIGPHSIRFNTGAAVEVPQPVLREAL